MLGFILSELHEKHIRKLPASVSVEERAVAPEKTARGGGEKRLTRRHRGAEGSQDELMRRRKP